MEKVLKKLHIYSLNPAGKMGGCFLRGGKTHANSTFFCCKKEYIFGFRYNLSEN